MNRRICCSFWLLFLSVIVLPRVNAIVTSPPATSQITQQIDPTNRVMLVGNTNVFVTAGTNIGEMPDSTYLSHVQLLLRRSDDRTAALERFIKDLNDRTSPNYHQWLSAKQFGSLYGPAEQDVSTVASWLSSNGFTIETTYSSLMVIDFSGTVGNIRQAFGTSLAKFDVNGQTFISNTSDPSIPAALAPVVSGIVSLNNYFPKPLLHRMTEPAQKKSLSASGADLSEFTRLAEFTYSGATGKHQFIAPGDFNTIYNIGPVWAAGYRGAGQTIVVIEDTAMYAPDWNTFRSAFGLSGYAGTFTQVYPSPTSGSNNCFPSVNGAESEAALDAEWASVAAPDADIILAECNDTDTTFGGLIAAENLLNGPSPPPIMSVSYGSCEAAGGATINASFNSAWQQAVTEGTTVIVSAGDQGAATCSAGYPVSVYGVGVSSFSSTPYNVAVGGTDFRDTADGTAAVYWSDSNNAFGGSALSYIPEIPWNDSCAGSFLLNYLVGKGQLASPDPVAYCNSAQGASYVDIGAGAGGPSACATGVPLLGGVIGGSCLGYNKPDWQAGVYGVPADGVRGVPDISLFSANGFWNHALWLCNSDFTEGGGTCDYANDPDGTAAVNAAGGTSFAAPAYAGIQALVNQVSGDRQGNMNVLLYQLAAQQYGTPQSPNFAGLSNCNSNQGNSIGPNCIFNDVTSGDIVLPCAANTPNCYTPTNASGFNCLESPCGILSSTNPASLSGAFSAGPGWDFATGLGSINVANLVAAVPQNLPAVALQFSAEPISTYLAGESVAVTVSVVNRLGQVVFGDQSSSISLAITECGNETISSVTVVNGTATFRNLHFYTPSEGLTLIATSSAPGLSEIISNRFDIQANSDLLFHDGLEVCTP